MTELTAINDLLAKTKALEARYRKDSPRAWAEKVISEKANIEDVPEHFRPIVNDHVATHRMHVQNASDRILGLPNGKARLDYFNSLPEALKPFVRDRVHEMKNHK